MGVPPQKDFEIVGLIFHLLYEKSNTFQTLIAKLSSSSVQSSPVELSTALILIIYQQVQ